MSNSILLSPGINFMQRLSFRNKFIVLAVLFIMPIAWLMFFYISDSLTIINSSVKERNGIQFLKSIPPVLKSTVTVRSLTNTYLNGNKDIKERLDRAIEKVNTAFDALEVTESELQNDLTPSTRVETLREKWTSLTRSSLSKSAVENFHAYSEYIDSLHAYIVHIADVSNLILDPDLDTYYLMDSLVVVLPQMLDRLGHARGLGASVTVKKKFTSAEFTMLVSITDEIKLYGNKLRMGFDKVYGATPEVKDTLGGADIRFNKQWKDFVKTIDDQLIKPDSVLISSNDFLSHGMKIIDGGYKLYEDALPVLETLIEERISDKEFILYETILIIVGILLLVGYLFVSFSSSVIKGIEAINSTVGELSQGNFQASANVNSSDEVASVAENLNVMITKISNLLSQVVNSANQVASAAEQASTTAAQAQDGINRQNSEIEQVATAINEMTATVSEVAQNTANAAELTQTADTEANTGRTIVSQTIDSINRLSGEMESSSSVIQDLETQSESIGTVLDVIRGIAEQTNLLALNAAIEAARAGEQGRGFAVVADEVRTLASRTQESTEEINDMIGKLQTGARNAVEAMNQGTTQTSQSVEQAVEAGAALDRISSAVSTIHDMNTQIASAAEEQSSVSEEINRNIVNIRDIAEATVEGANQTAQSSAAMSDVANELIGLVGEFKV